MISNLKSPTAPLKFSGFPSNGNSFTLIFFLVDENDLVRFRVIGFPKKSPRPVGTPINTSIVIGSMTNFPDLVGINKAFFSTTYR